MAEFTSDLRHVPSGSLAAPADRDGSSGASTAAAVVPATQQGPIRWGELARDQLTCQETQEVLTSNTSLLLEIVVYQGAHLWCDPSTGALRPLVPASQRRAIFQQVHGLSHTGSRATWRLVATRFVWPGLATDVVAWCKECAACNRAKVTRLPSTTMEKMEIPTARFSHVHVDIVGPLPPSREGYTHLLTMIDKFTRWPELPTSTCSAAVWGRR